jgi:hypothetical protein
VIIWVSIGLLNPYGLDTAARSPWSSSTGRTLTLIGGIISI